MTKKNILFIFAKIAFASIVLFFLFQKADISHVWSRMKHAHVIPVLIGTFLCWSTVLVAGWRWHQLLQIFEIKIPLLSLICIAQIGQFFLVFLPGPLGDDITRMLYIARFTKGKKVEACSTVMIDRIIGLISILVIATICIPWQWKTLSTVPQTQLLALGIIVIGSSACLFTLLFFFFAHPTHWWVTHCLKILQPATLKDEVSRMWGLLCSQKRTLFQVISAAMITQLLLCGMFYFAGSALEIKLPFTLWLSFVPIILAANAVPITLAGVGVREYLVLLFLGVLASVGKEQALAASLLACSMMLSVCLLGGIFYIVYRPSTTNISL